MTMSLYNIWFDISKSLAEPPLTSCPVEHWMLKSGNVFLKQQEAMKIQIVKMDQTAIKQVTQIYQVFQNVISNLSNLSSSDNNMERRFLAQEREKKLPQAQGLPVLQVWWQCSQASQEVYQGKSNWSCHSLIIFLKFIGMRLWLLIWQWRRSDCSLLLHFEEPGVLHGGQAWDPSALLRDPNAQSKWREPCRYHFQG